MSRIWKIFFKISQSTLKLWLKFNRINIRIIGATETEAVNPYEEPTAKDRIAQKLPELKSAYTHNLDT